jgi:PhnB protein
MSISNDTYRTLTPYLVVANADREIAFLEKAFGATVTSCQRNTDNTVMHAELTFGNSQVMLGQAGGQWKAREAAIFVWVPGCDVAYDKAIAAGAISESSPEDKPYGQRMAGVIDSNGVTWWIGSPLAQS